MVFTNETRSFYRLGIPIMLQYMITSAIGLVSSLMVGGLGGKSVVALGIGNQIYFVYSLVILGLYAGSGVLVSHLWGARNYDSAKNAMAVSTVLGIFVGILFLIGEKTMLSSITGLFTSDAEVHGLVADYMDSVILSFVIMPIFLSISTGFRSTKRPVAPMLISLAAVLVNVFLCFGFIYGNFGMAEMGIAGAGAATLFSRMIEAAAAIALWYRSDLRFGAEVLRGMSTSLVAVLLKASSAIIMNDLCWGLGIVIYNVLYSKIGFDALTAVQINSVILNFFVTVAFGFSGASAVIIGNRIGSGEEDRIMEDSSSIIRMTIVSAAFFGFVMYIVTGAILPLYDISEKAASSVMNVALILSFALPLRFLAVLFLTGILRGGGDMVYTMYLELGTMWLIGVPLAAIAILVFDVSLETAYMVAVIEDVIKSVVVILRFRSKKWIHNLAEDVG
jgi:putative MATE family efflux protein